MCYSVRLKRAPRYLSQFPDMPERIYPGNYAPVLYAKGEELVIEMMRYGAYPPFFIKTRSQYSSFNARRDNLLSAFWSNAFMKHHGLIVIEGFYEWVPVKNLLQGKVVKLKEVRDQFHEQAEERKKKVLAQGKTYKPTPTELKDPTSRQIVIEFKPKNPNADLFVPVIFSWTTLEDGERVKGFAIVTDEPLPDVKAAGHDRSPVILPERAIEAWLHPEKYSAAAMVKLLGEAELPGFSHGLPLVS